MVWEPCLPLPTVPPRPPRGPGGGGAAARGGGRRAPEAQLVFSREMICATVGPSASKAVTARGGSRKVASETWLADGPSADGAFQ